MVERASSRKSSRKFGQDLVIFDIAGILTLHVDGQRNLCDIVVSDMKIDMLNIRLVV